MFVLSYGNRLTTEWLGPAEGDVSEDYHKLFGRTIEISGACLFCDSDDNRWKAYQVKAKGRGHDLTIDELRGLSRSELMTVLGPPGFEQRYDAWAHYHQTHVAAPGFLADVDHHPVTGRNSGGMLFPVQLTHGSIVEFGGGNSDSASSFRMATAKEHMTAQAFRVLPAARPAGTPECSLGTIVDELGISQADIKKMSGNGMNLATQSGFMSFVFSNVARKNTTCGKAGHVAADDWG